MKIYEVVFKATKTCQNGKEVRYCKSVYMNPFDKDNDGSRRHRPVSRQIELGKSRLAQEHYYDIEYVGTRIREVMYVSSIT